MRKSSGEDLFAKFAREAKLGPKPEASKFVESAISHLSKDTHEYAVPLLEKFGKRFSKSDKPLSLRKQ